MSDPSVIREGVHVVEIVGAATNALVTWALVIVGWWIVQDQTRFQDGCRSNVQRLDSLRTMLDEVERVALEMHASSFDEFKSQRIRRLLKKIAFDCKLLLRSGGVDPDWTKYMVDMRQAITLQNFDKSTFKPQTEESSVLNTIEVAKDEFEGYLTSCICNCSQAKRSLLLSLSSMLPSRGKG